MTRPAVLVGYYGMLNFGDDLFVSLICGLRPHMDERKPLWVVAPGLEEASRSGARFLVPARSAATWRSHGPAGSALRLAVNMFAAASADTVVLGGGSVLTSVRGVRREQFRLRRLLRVRRWVALGVSVGPVAAEARGEVDDLLRVMDVLVVRDERSQLESERPSRLGGDLAALIPFSSLDPGNVDRRAGIVYAPKNSWDDAMQDRVIRRISVHARETGEPVTVLALNCHEREGDLSTADAAMQMFEDAGVPAVRAAYTELGVRATVKTIASAARVVTGRLHGGIVSFVTGTPFVLLSDHEKMDDFLDDVAMPESHRGGLDDSGADAVGELFRNPKVPANDEYLARARSAYLGQP